MTRNPETTEAARVVAALTEKQKEIVCNASGAGMFNSGRVAGLQIAKHIVQAVLAVSTAATEGERADGWYATRCDFPHCLLTVGHVAEHWPASPAVTAAEDERPPLQLRDRCLNCGEPVYRWADGPWRHDHGGPCTYAAERICDRCEHPETAHPNGGCEANLCGCWEFTAPAPAVTAVPGEPRRQGFDEYDQSPHPPYYAMHCPECFDRLAEPPASQPDDWDGGLR